MDKTYTETVRCYNCNYIGDIIFDSGTLIKNSSVECPKCGCKHQFYATLKEVK